MSADLEIELSADGARVRSGQIGTCPVDPFTALASLGIRTIRYPLAAIDGAYMFDGSNGWAVVSSKTGYVRQRFTAAHELGHHVAQRADSPPTFVDVSLDATDSEDEEATANAFAAALLMPEAELRRESERRPDREDLALAVVAIWHASLEAATRRLASLDLISPEDEDKIRSHKSPLGPRIERIGLVPPPPRKDFGRREVDEGLRRLVEKLRDLRLLDHPGALLNLTPDQNQ